MCQFWQATRLMVQDWRQVNQPLGAIEFSCFHVKIFPEDEESVIGTDSAFCSTLSCWSADVISTMSSSASDGSLESLESGGSLFLIHIHVIMPSSIRTFHRTNLKNTSIWLMKIPVNGIQFIDWLFRALYFFICNNSIL